MMVIPNQKDYVQNIITYFRDNNAVSADDSIPMNPTIWAEIGFTQLVVEDTNLLKMYPFLKKTPDNKWWFDESELETYLKKVHNSSTKLAKFFLILISVLLIGAIISLVLPFVI